MNTHDDRINPILFTMLLLVPFRCAMLVKCDKRGINLESGRVNIYKSQTPFC